MEKVLKVLVVEDEVKISAVIKSFLESKGYLTVCAYDGKEAIELFEKENISIILLDLMLPVMSGEEVCSEIRKISKVPIIMLTAKSNEEDMLKGLGVGADDYIMKPFSFKELHARIEAVIRRSGEYLEQVKDKWVSQDKELVVDYAGHIVMKNNVEIKLTPNEFKVLNTLMKYPNKVFTRDELIASALGYEFEGYDRTIDSHIKNIRQKIEKDPKNPTYVKTIHGIGYRFGGE